MRPLSILLFYGDAVSEQLAESLQDTLPPSAVETANEAPTDALTVVVPHEGNEP